MAPITDAGERQGLNSPFTRSTTLLSGPRS